MDYYISVLKKYAIFSGRARRAEYWYFVLFYFLVGIVLELTVIGLGFLIEVNITPIVLVYRLALLVPTATVGVRRMHDVNKSGWFLLFPFYNLVLLITDGTKGDNKYGPDSKERKEILTQQNILKKESFDTRKAFEVSSIIVGIMVIVISSSYFPIKNFISYESKDSVTEIIDFEKVFTFIDSNGNKKRVVSRLSSDNWFDDIFITDENLSLDSAIKIGKGYTSYKNYNMRAKGLGKRYIIIERIGPGDTANLSIVDEDGKIIEESLGDKIGSQGIELSMLSLFYFDSWDFNHHSFYVEARSFIDVPLRFLLLIEAETGNIIERKLIDGIIWSEEEVIQIVRLIPETKDWWSESSHIEINSKAGDTYTVLLYDLLESGEVAHKVYFVNSRTGGIRDRGY